MKLAKLEFNKVVEILENQSEMPHGEYPYLYIDISTNLNTINIGNIYNGDGIFNNPTRLLNKRQFRNLFTTEEKIKIDNYETSNIPEETKSHIRTMMNDLDATPIVDLDLNEVQLAIRLLAVIGLISATRAEEIIS